MPQPQQAGGLAAAAGAAAAGAAGAGAAGAAANEAAGGAGAAAASASGAGSAAAAAVAAPGTTGVTAAVAESNSCRHAAKQAPKPNPLSSLWARVQQQLSPKKTLAALNTSSGRQQATTASGGSDNPASSAAAAPAAGPSRSGAGAAGATQPAAASTQPTNALRGPGDLTGFGFAQLNPKFAAEVYLLLGQQRWRLQRAMLLLEQADGFISFDHVIETAKRVKSSDKAMLIGVGATGNVLDWWFTTSTSLADVADDLVQLNARQKSPVLVVTVDDPRTMEGELRKAFPGAAIKMDAGHVIISRLGKLLDKTHCRYRKCYSIFMPYHPPLLTASATLGPTPSVHAVSSPLSQCWHVSLIPAES